MFFIYGISSIAATYLGQMRDVYTKSVCTSCVPMQWNYKNVNTFQGTWTIKMETKLHL